MEIKWFFVIIGIILTITILIGIYFIATSISVQSKAQYDSAINITKTQYESQLNRSSGNFNQSKLIHDALYRNITDLKKGLDPILAVVKNATQAEIDRQIHYNQTAEDFKKIKTVLEIKLQDHKTLGIVNSTVAEIYNVLLGKNDTGGIIIKNDTNTNSTPVPTPLPGPIVKNDTGDIIVENVTNSTTS